MESTTSLELGPKVLVVFEDYAKGNASSSHVAHCKGIPGGFETAGAPPPPQRARIVHACEAMT